MLQVTNMVSTMQMLGIFFKYSSKRERKVEQTITEIATESLWNRLSQKLLLNHSKRNSNDCVKNVGWKGTHHLQI